LFRRVPGLLMPVDDVAALAGAMRRLGTWLRKRRQFAEAGRVWAIRFQWDHILNELEQRFADG